MKNDQIIRAVAAVTVLGAYFVHVGINGGERVNLMLLGTWHPFPITILTILVIAVPEVIDRLPVLPSRKK
jgi:hypothetical protein